MPQISPTSFEDSLVDALPLPACICEAPSGLIIRSNAQAVALWGQQPEPDTRIHDLLRFIRPDGAPLPPEAFPLAAAIADGTADANRQAVIERRGQPSVLVRINILPLSTVGQRRAGLMLFHSASERRLRREGLLNESDGRIRERAPRSSGKSASCGAKQLPGRVRRCRTERDERGPDRRTRVRRYGHGGAERLSRRRQPRPAVAARRPGGERRPVDRRRARRRRRRQDPEACRIQPAGGRPDDPPHQRPARYGEHRSRPADPDRATSGRRQAGQRHGRSVCDDGGGEGHRARRRASRASAERDARRSADPAGAREPSQQCDQVHPGWRQSVDPRANGCRADCSSRSATRASGFPRAGSRRSSSGFIR